MGGGGGRGRGAFSGLWADPWIPRRPSTPNGRGEPIRVAQLLNHETGQWEEDLVRFVFSAQDAADILSRETWRIRLLGIMNL